MKIEIDDKLFFNLDTMSEIYCDAYNCKYNYMDRCTLKKIYINKEGRCSSFINQLKDKCKHPVDCLQFHDFDGGSGLAKIICGNCEKCLEWFSFSNKLKYYRRKKHFLHGCNLHNLKQAKAELKLINQNIKELEEAEKNESK